MSTLPIPQPAIALDLVVGGLADLGEVMATMDASFDPCFGEAWTRSQCAGIMALPGVWLLLARIDGTPAGFALARAVMDEAELLLLAVRPDRRRAGVGRSLLDQVCENARTSRYDQCDMLTFALFFHLSSCDTAFACHLESAVL